MTTIENLKPENSIKLLILFLVAFSLSVVSIAQTLPTPEKPAQSSLRKLTAADKRELNLVFPLKTREYLLRAKSLFITDVRSRRSIELSNPVSKNELLEALFFDAALGRKVQDTCRTPEFWIATESGDKSKVEFSLSYDCNDITGGGVDYHLIQGRVDGKNSRSKPLFERLFQ